MRKIVAYLATSADGYIARKNGGIDWLDRPAPEDGYNFTAFIKSIDTIIWGRATYDLGLKIGAPSMGPGVLNYVFTHRPAKPAEGVEFVNQPVRKFAQRLRATPGKDIWMMGGAKIIASFLDAGELDEFSIHVIPVMIGAGIPLIAPKRRNVELKLLNTKRFPDGVVHLHYEVRKDA